LTEDIVANRKVKTIQILNCKSENGSRYGGSIMSFYIYIISGSIRSAHPRLTTDEWAIEMTKKGMACKLNHETSFRAPTRTNHFFSSFKGCARDDG
jgi:hypothetical protein